MSREKPENPVKEPKRVQSDRVRRGGYWNDYPYDARASDRYYIGPSGRFINIGFRLARTVKK